jgi:hypothetical protein
MMSTESRLATRSRWADAIRAAEGKQQTEQRGAVLEDVALDLRVVGDAAGNSALLNPTLLLQLVADVLARTNKGCSSLGRWTGARPRAARCASSSRRWSGTSMPRSARRSSRRTTSSAPGPRGGRRDHDVERRPVLLSVCRPVGVAFLACVAQRDHPFVRVSIDLGQQFAEVAAEEPVEQPLVFLHRCGGPDVSVVES